MNDFGARLQMLRKQRGLTQKTLAARINKSFSAVSSYETNAQMPPLDVLTSIAAVLNVSLDYLVGFEHREIIVIDALSERQKELLNMLMTEFSNPTNGTNSLSPAQKDILDKMLCIFFNK